MSQVRHLWAVLMQAVEESLVAFSRVGPDLVGHSQLFEERSALPAAATLLRGNYFNPPKILAFSGEVEQVGQGEVKGYGGARQLS
jgi:hypothetical protein